MNLPYPCADSSIGKYQHTMYSYKRIFIQKQVNVSQVWPDRKGTDGHFAHVVRQLAEIDAKGRKIQQDSAAFMA
ncbi:hypothetical protein GV64_17040 [Endozoicomonas elysicola]|uniref:Uncharacterized protein n=1 Tax=Endozoicomonas elysicola TaxID=305900 RepID=A0A081KDH9_9GAMM|nr:hypothetical protein GV64_17040 [Endozoicomonas elysicola]